MTDYRDVEKAAATREAAEAAGHPHPRGYRAGDIESALMRYLGAEAYHEKVEEERDQQPAGNQGKEGKAR